MLVSNLNTNFQDNNQKERFLKKVFLIALLLFFAGFVLQFIHWPFAAQLKVISMGQFGILSILHLLAAREKNQRIHFLAYSVIDLSFFYIGYRTLYWPSSTAVFIVLVLILLLLLFSFQKLKAKISRLIIVAFVSYLFSMHVFTMKSHEIYYSMNLTETLHSYERQNVSYAWYRYAWFLYTDHKRERAYNALYKAKKIEEQAGNDQLVEKLEAKIADFNSGRWDGEYPR